MYHRAVLEALPSPGSTEPLSGVYAVRKIRDISSSLYEDVTLFVNISEELKWPAFIVLVSTGSYYSMFSVKWVYKTVVPLYLLIWSPTCFHFPWERAFTGPWQNMQITTEAPRWWAGLGPHTSAISLSIPIRWTDAPWGGLQKRALLYHLNSAGVLLTLGICSLQTLGFLGLLLKTAVLHVAVCCT